MPFSFFVFLYFTGKVFGGSQVRIAVRETARKGVWQYVVHASGDSLKGDGIRKEKVRGDPESVSSWEGVGGRGKGVLLR